MPPHLVLRQLADGKARRLELRLRQRPEEVGLILPRVPGAQEQVPPSRRVACHARIVARRDGRRLPGAGAPEERAEFQIAVALKARNRRLPPPVRIGERTDDGAIELPLHVEDVVRDAERAGDGPRIVRRLRSAAAPEPLRRLVGRGPGRDAHGDSDDLVALLDEQRGRDGGVDAPAHPDDDSLGHAPECRRSSSQCLAPSSSVSRTLTRRASTLDRKSTRLNSSHVRISYAVFCLKKKNRNLLLIQLLSHYVDSYIST